AFEETYGITYPSMPDPDAEIMYSLRGQVAPNAVPSTLVIDQEGRVAARISGAADPSVLRAMIDKVGAEAAPTTSEPPARPRHWPAPCSRRSPSRREPDWSPSSPRACCPWGPATSATSPGSPARAPPALGGSAPGPPPGACPPAAPCSSPP